jgi:hypothetical protein
MALNYVLKDALEHAESNSAFQRAELTRQVPYKLILEKKVCKNQEKTHFI